MLLNDLRQKLGAHIIFLQNDVGIIATHVACHGSAILNVYPILFADYRQTQQFASAVPFLVPMLSEGALENAVLSAECLHSTADLFPLHTANYLISSYCLTFIGEALQQLALSCNHLQAFHCRLRMVDICLMKAK